MTDSVELAIPFRIGDDGAPAVVSDPNVILRQHVISVVGTQRGERVMRPDYGMDVMRFNFSAADDTTNSALQTEVSQALSNWEPSAKFQGATMILNDDNIANLSVHYQDVSTNNQNQTLTVNVNASGR